MPKQVASLKEFKKDISLTTESLLPVLNMLKKEDIDVIVSLKEEIGDTWVKNQIFRTETEMRISVLNDGKHPTKASKYWQAVREMNGVFNSIVGTSFDLRTSEVKRLRLEKRLENAIEKNDTLAQLEIQIALDKNLFNRANLELVIHDYVRELKLWSEIKEELADGSFDTTDPNTHQAHSFKLTFENRAKGLGPNSGPAEYVNALGPLTTLHRLSTEDNKLLGFDKKPLKLKDSNGSK
jgi:hypothetical protein